MRTPSNVFRAPLLWGCLLALGACAHPGSNTAGITGGAVTPPPPPPITFSMDDLNGDWFGQLVPNSVARDVRNFYIRVSAGEAIEAADSQGNQWTSIDNSTLDFTTEGFMTADFESILFTNSMVVTAQMDDAMTTLTGNFSHLVNEVLVEGTFVLKRSIGAGQFSSAVMEGTWEGMGVNARGKRRIINLVVDALGAVISGELIRPLDSFVQHTYSAGPGNEFVFTNDSVGRMDNVQITSDDGSVLFFTYALVDEDGTLLGGPGFDSLMGTGVGTLEKAVAE